MNFLTSQGDASTPIPEEDLQHTRPQDNTFAGPPQDQSTSIDQFNMQGPTDRTLVVTNPAFAAQNLQTLAAQSFLAQTLLPLLDSPI